MVGTGGAACRARSSCGRTHPNACIGGDQAAFGRLRMKTKHPRHSAREASIASARRGTLPFVAMRTAPVIAILMGVLAFAAPAFAGEPVGSITRLTGSAAVIRGGNRLAASVAMSVMLRDPSAGGAPARDRECDGERSDFIASDPHLERGGRGSRDRLRGRVHRGQAVPRAAVMHALHDGRRI